MISSSTHTAPALSRMSRGFRCHSGVGLSDNKGSSASRSWDSGVLCQLLLITCEGKQTHGSEPWVLSRRYRRMLCPFFKSFNKSMALRSNPAQHDGLISDVGDRLVFR